MHASQVTSRRHERLDDDELYPVARGADRRSDSYGRSNRHPGRAEPYVGSTPAHRGYADSSRTRRTDDWRVAEPPYTSSTHDKYHDDAAADTRRSDYQDRSDGWSSRMTDRSQHPSSRRGWTRRDGNSDTSYPANRSWGRTSRNEEPSRSTNGNDDLTRADYRYERGRDIYNREESHPVRERSLRPRDDMVAVEPTRDRRSGWVEHADKRQRWKRDAQDSGKERERDIVDDDHDVDRKWVPAAAWKSGERDDRLVPARYERPEPPPPFIRSNKKPGKNKKKGHQGYQKRDTRRDDNMNKYVYSIFPTSMSMLI